MCVCICWGRAISIRKRRERERERRETNGKDFRRAKNNNKEKAAPHTHMTSTDVVILQHWEMERREHAGWVPHKTVANPASDPLTASPPPALPTPFSVGESRKIQGEPSTPLFRGLLPFLDTHRYARLKVVEGVNYIVASRIKRKTTA